MTIGEAKKDVRRPKQAMVTKQNEGKPTILDGTRRQPSDILSLDAAIWRGDCESFLAGIPEEPLFDLVVTSPPYNIGKSYEKKDDLAKYLEWQERVIDLLIPRLRDTGSLCWQVGNFVDNGQIAPLDIEFAPINMERAAGRDWRAGKLTVRARSKPERYAFLGANHRPETCMVTGYRALTGLDKNREKRGIRVAGGAKLGSTGDHRISHRPRNPATAGVLRA